jgi:nicotinamidase-related amidase
MENTALLVIDMQVGLLEDKYFPIFQSEQLISNVNKLISKARTASVSVIFVRHTEGIGEPLEINNPKWQISSELLINEHDAIINKYTPDSFHQTKLSEILNERNITNLVIAGLQTEYCIDTTCKRAFTLGYQTILVSDAHSTCDNSILSAQKIIEHHNQMLSSWFVTLNTCDLIDFNQI